MIPASIKIGGLVYQINQIVMGDEAEVTHAPCTINININLSESKKSLALKHEIFEIINNEHQLNLKHHKIMTLAFEWHQVTTDNPGVFG
jgi:hypothetical protein